MTQSSDNAFIASRPAPRPLSTTLGGSGGVRVGRAEPLPPAHALKLVRRGCLVVPLGGDRPLARACVELLRSELPSLRPTLDAPATGVDVVWACGYRPGAEGELERLRALHPAAKLVVTGRGIGLHGSRLMAAGADRVVDWPASIAELRDALRAPRARA